MSKNEFNHRGQCVSERGKYTKSGELKRSGNFSHDVFRRQHLQSRTYHVRTVTKDSGVQILVVGDHTPLAALMGEMVASLAVMDEHFNYYVQTGIFHLNEAKQYDAIRSLRRRETPVHAWELQPYSFIYTEQIYTDGDFTYPFPDY